MRISSSRFRFVVAVLLAFALQLPAHAEVKAGEHFGDWIFECMALAEGKTACALTQTILSKKDNQRIVKFSLAHNGNTGNTQLTAVVPLGVYLPSGVSGTIDQGKPFQYTVQTCVQQGCIATCATDSSLLKALQAGQKLTVNFSGNGGKTPFSIDGSLKGLAEGMKAAKLN